MSVNILRVGIIVAVILIEFKKQKEGLHASCLDPIFSHKSTTVVLGNIDMVG